MGGGRDKRKKKNPTAPGQGAAKTERKTEKAEEKRLRRLDKEGDDIDAILARLKLEDAAATAVTIEEDCAPPTARCNCTLTVSPLARAKELVLLGGEYFDNTKTYVYGDLFLYNIDKHKWCADMQERGERAFHVAECVRADVLRALRLLCRCRRRVRSPNSPLPRCAHQAVAYKQYILVFGGEFTSPNQEKFHHYKELWRLDLATYEWEQLSLRGGPSARRDCT